MLIECILLFASLCHAMRDKPVLVLGVAQSAALLTDGITTEQRVQRGYTETDPVTRLVLGAKPTWGGMAPLGAAQCLLETWLAERMHASRYRWVRRLWWVPQTIGISGNIWGARENISNARNGP